MPPPPPDPTDDDEERRIEHRFAELVSRFWRGPERPDPLPERDPL